MKIIIEITNDIYEHAKESTEDSRDEFDAIRAISNGIPINNDPVLNCMIGKEVLYKIRAEIKSVIQEETVIDHSGGEYESIISKLDPVDVFQIIDKYIIESEV